MYIHLELGLGLDPNPNPNPNPSQVRGGGRVYIHCHQGVSRSSAMAIAYLMYANGWGYEPAYSFVRERRGIASPNAGFIARLGVGSGLGFGLGLGSGLAPPCTYRAPTVHRVYASRKG